MKNKKAWVRIVEATIAVLILLGFSLYLINQHSSSNEVSEQVSRIEYEILEEAMSDSTIRAEVLDGKNSLLDEFVETRLPPVLNFITKICNPEEACLAELPEEAKNKEIYSEDIVVSANLTYYNPKKVAIFAWVK